MTLVLVYKLKKIVELYGIEQNSLFVRKVQFIHDYSLQFNDIMPYVKNLEGFWSFEKNEFSS